MSFIYCQKVSKDPKSLSLRGLFLNRFMVTKHIWTKKIDLNTITCTNAQIGDTLQRIKTQYKSLKNIIRQVGCIYVEGIHLSEDPLPWSQCMERFSCGKERISASQYRWGDFGFPWQHPRLHWPRRTNQSLDKQTQKRPCVPCMCKFNVFGHSSYKAMTTTT